MAVMIGSARIDENGKIKGGVAGDQKQTNTPDLYGEVSMQNWYLHSLGWRVFRCKDSFKAMKIAWDMEAACNNKYIGYDQTKDTLYDVVKPLGFDCSKVKTPCETDCAYLVRICVLYAGINVPVFYTWTEPDVLLATGEFTELTDKKYTTSSDYLRCGDILVTPSKGHTVVVLSNGSKATDAMMCLVKYTFNNVQISAGASGTRAKQLTRSIVKTGYHPIVPRLASVSNSALCNVRPFIGGGNENTLYVNYYRASGGSGKIDASVVVAYVRNDCVDILW